MKTDREILEYAAKACEINRNDYVENEARNGLIVTGFYSNLLEEVWNPLTNSADCAAMCAKLEIDTMWYGVCVSCEAHPTQDNVFVAVLKDHNNDREAAWRYAATMVAAKIGGMK